MAAAPSAAPALKCSRLGWQRAGASSHSWVRASAAHTLPRLVPCLRQAYKEEGEGDEPSTSGRDPEEEAKWAAFDSMVESWLGGSKPRVEVSASGAACCDAWLKGGGEHSLP